MDWPILLLSIVVAIAVIGMIHSIYMLTFLNRLGKRVKEWRSGRRCNCKEPKHHDIAERIGDGNPFRYCQRCDAFYYDKKRSTA